MSSNTSNTSSLVTWNRLINSVNTTNSQVIAEQGQVAKDITDRCSDIQNHLRTEMGTLNNLATYTTYVMMGVGILSTATSALAAGGMPNTPDQKQVAMEVGAGLGKMTLAGIKVAESEKQGEIEKQKVEIEGLEMSSSQDIKAMQSGTQLEQTLGQTSVSLRNEYGAACKH